MLGSRRLVYRGPREFQKGIHPRTRLLVADFPEGISKTISNGSS